MGIKSKLDSQDALLEAGCEEIPSSYLPPALEFMRSFCQDYLKEKALPANGILVLGTPRRLTLILSGIPPKSEGRTEEQMGPSLKIAKDETGQWTDAARGFARSCEVPVDSLEIRATDKGEYLCAIKKSEGIKSEELLKTLFLEMLASIPFPKKMVWNETGFKFARPIRNLVALLNQKVLPLTVAGVRATNKTFPLAHLSSATIKIRSPKDYLRTLKNHCILVDPEERKKAIQNSFQQPAQRVNGTVQLEPELLEDVAWMVEYPSCVLGEFDPKYLALPPEVLTTCMKKQQKFFSLVNSHNQLLPYFIGVRNGISENQAEVRKGYEKVLNARLADAEFFYREDLKKKLEDHLQKANRIQLQERLGTIKDKIARMNKIAGFLTPHLNPLPSRGNKGVVPAKAGSGGEGCDFSIIERAIALCKFDLATQMVYEFGELQGRVGKIYALAYGENARVAQAIQEHYYPLTNQSELPASAESSAVALSEKLEGLIGHFYIGISPSGNSDPYGMRRQATGILRILLHNQWHLSLRELAEFAFSQFSCGSTEEQESILQSSLGISYPFGISSPLNFFRERFLLLMQEAGFVQDEIVAVVKNDQDPDSQDLRVVLMKEKIQALHNTRLRPEFEELSIAFKRAVNILKQAKSRGLALAENGIQTELFQQEEEKRLYSAICEVGRKNQPYLADRKYDLALSTLVTVKPPLDQFFEKVMVMDENPSLCKNRLSLLALLEGCFKQLADFSLLQNKETKE